MVFDVFLELHNHIEQSQITQVIADSGKQNLESTRFDGFLHAYIARYQVKDGPTRTLLQGLALWKSLY